MKRPVLTRATEEENLRYMDDTEASLMFLLSLQTSNDLCCDFDENGQVIPLVVDNKPVCFPKNICTDFSVLKFDPWFNSKLTQVLVQRAVNLYAMDNNPDIASICITPNRATGKVKAYVNNNKGFTLVESSEYVNEAISWVDLIIRLRDFGDMDDYQAHKLCCLDEYITYLRNLDMYNKERGIVTNATEQQPANGVQFCY